MSGSSITIMERLQIEFFQLISKVSSSSIMRVKWIGSYKDIKTFVFSGSYHENGNRDSISSNKDDKAEGIQYHYCQQWLFYWFLEEW